MRRLTLCPAPAIPPHWTGVIFIEQRAFDPAPPSSVAVDPNRPPCEPGVPNPRVSPGSLIQSIEHGVQIACKCALTMAVGQFEDPPPKIRLRVQDPVFASEASHSKRRSDIRKAKSATLSTRVAFVCGRGPFFEGGASPTWAPRFARFRDLQ